MLLMPPDVESGIVTAAGLYKPRADWTDAGQRHLRAALEEALRARGAEPLPYPDSPPPEHVQPIKLVRALENTLLRYVFAAPGAPTGRSALPTKRDDLDWSLGEALAPLRAGTEADYALFVHVRDRNPSGGRTAANIAMALLFGAIATSDEQAGFAVLLDLKTGRLLWTNLAGSAFGDIREARGAGRAAQALLEDFPL